ncbi:hypothetical protein QYF36_022742 [Acer negundo]|nr:hypothetical protein QYF36_022742 [Acer negundo]
MLVKSRSEKHEGVTRSEKGMLQAKNAYIMLPNARLNQQTSYFGKIGLAVTVLVLVVMLIRYFARNTRDEMGNREFQGKKTKFDNMMNSVFGIVVAAVRFVVVAIPEGSS